MEVLQGLYSILIGLDYTLFVLIHNDSDSAFLDPVMLAIRSPLNSIPIYCLVFILAFRKLKGRQLFTFLVLSLILVAVTDSVCAQILKPFFGRLRPCYDAMLSRHLRPLLPCGGMYSFPSNHAINHFALTLFWTRCFKFSGTPWINLLWFWAILIGYAQVYVGKHFPADIIAGAGLGMLSGYGCYRLSRAKFQNRFVA